MWIPFHIALKQNTFEVELNSFAMLIQVFSEEELILCVWGVESRKASWKEKQNTCYNEPTSERKKAIKKPLYTRPFVLMSWNHII